MLQLRKTSNQRSGEGGGIPLTVIDENNSAANPISLNQNLINLQAQQFDDAINNQLNLEWIYKPWVQQIVRTCALCSFISICANTPETFKNYKIVMYATYAIDLISSLVFTVEMIAKIKIRGLFKGDSAYIFDRWCQFDGLMVFFHIISVILQTFELSGQKKLYWSLFRCPRPLILIRVIRSLLKFRLPKNRINSILQRSSSQIYNVTIFFLFFMALYGILGVQFFGKLISHCVKNTTDPNETKISDFMIPDTYCSPKGPEFGFQCPIGMKCVEIDLTKSERGFNGFDEIITSIFTVYEAASQEGWVFLMYRATDSLPSWKAYFYFFSMIFFLAWLVKNVFIAVIIETFAEIRVQFQQMWGARGHETKLEQNQVLEWTDEGLKLVSVNENKSQGFAPSCFQKILRSSLFNMTMLLLVLANAIITANLKHTHKEAIDKRVLKNFYNTEVVFTLLFDFECLFKIVCLGFKSYIQRSIYKFEFILAVFTTLRLIPGLYQTELTYFQVLRIFRLIKSSPMLEDFVNKIFGPGKKLGSLIIFTMCLLIITSCVSMQLFCFIGSKDYKKFDTFDQALMSQFAIITNEGWTETMYETMRAIGENLELHYYTYFIPIYFIFSHMFCSLILLSLFVAVILDNLELDEDVKKIKQLKMREQSAETQETLPWRLRIFEKFSNQPQLVSLKRIPNEFETPKIRESFMRQFLENDINLIESSQKKNLSNQKNPEIITNEIGGVEKFKSRISIRSKSKSGQNSSFLESINENPLVNSSNKKDTQDSTLFRRRKITTPNAHAAQLRVVNNLRMQRASRYSIKKLAINNIVDNSNYQRLFTNDPNYQFPIAGINDNSKPTSDKPLYNPLNSERIRNIQTINRNGIISNLNPKARNTQNTLNGLNGSNGIDFKIFQFKKQQAELKRNQLEDDLKENHPYFDKPLFSVGRDSSFRKFCQMIIEARYQRPQIHREQNTTVKDQYKQFYKILGLVSYLDWIMVAMTIQSCIGMMFETPTRRLVDTVPLQIVEYIFVISMSIEMTLKVCAYGLFFTPNAVVKDFTGVLDLFIFSVSVMFLYLSPKEVVANSPAQMIMLLRCLRPLRIFTLVPHMRKVIYELCRGFKEILLVSILLVVLMFVFANYGIQMYGGKLARCNDAKILDKKNCTGMYKRTLFVTKLKLQGESSRHPSIWVPRVWSNPYNFNFDSIGTSMLALFEVLSLEGWLEVRDVIIERMGPRHAIFVHVFVFIGTLIGLTLFVGVVITNYSENKGTALLTVDQRRWLDLKGRIKLAQPLHIPPRPENSKFRGFIFDITQHKNFKRFSAFLVLLNCGLLSVPWRVDVLHTKPLATLAAIFTFLFLIEAAMKAIALGPMGYWQSRRNRFDLFVTILGLIWIIMHFVSFGKKELEELSNSFGFGVIVLRFFTIAGKHATLKMLMLTIIVSFFKSFFIIVGMFLLMLVYAFSGVILFGCVKSGHDLGRHANFRSSPNAIVLLLRIVTGEDWNKIMHDCMVAPPACTKGKNYWESDCGNFTAALLYFCSFYVIITYIVLNLLVAIIMENFSLFYSNEEDALLSYSDIRHFQIVWNIVDTNRKGVIPCRRVKFLLRLLRGRLEVDLEKDRLLFKHMCYEIERLNNGNDVTFHDVLSMLSYRSVDIRKSLKLEELIAREELEYQIEEEVAKQTIRNWLDKCLRRMRERGRPNSKQINKQNDIAIFKEQMGARQILNSQRLPSPPAALNQNPNQSHLAFFPSPLKSNSQVEQLSDKKALKSTTSIGIEKRELPSNSSDNENKKMSYTDLTSPQIKIVPSNPTKLKKKNTLDRQSQIISEEKLKKKNMFLMESQTMTTDVKNWWKSTIDQNNIFTNKSEF
ncbi:unnamed protein product [Brachionus calyciflorus]|uniref:Ion transport domain-containing protein n=1 Tax=Brachionus calyciflorus TaxID=104777 RepID=A0A813MKV0_9BILA|nr:unnamed protein product [Brachionus calyciflorus]